MSKLLAFYMIARRREMIVKPWLLLGTMLGSNMLFCLILVVLQDWCYPSCTDEEIESERLNGFLKVCS